MLGVADGLRALGRMPALRAAQLAHDDAARVEVDLLADSGGDESLAIASYYQGAASVREVGMLPETQRYVADVMALRGRFGP